MASALAGALMLVSGGAAAEDKDSDAERLFREGQKLLEERRFGEACPKFEAAYSKDRQLGTLINLAFCHKEQGAIWYAWLEFREAEVKATELNRPDRRDFAAQRLAELQKQLPKAIIDNPARVQLTDVLVEDRKVWEAERGAVFAVEAGQRKFTFKAKGKKPATALVNVAKSERTQRVTVPELEDAPPDEPPPSRDPAPTSKGEPRPRPPDADSNPGSTQRTFGWISIGVGGVGAVLGSIMGLITYSSPCADGAVCSQQEKDSGNLTGAISTVGFVVGGIGIGAGALLILTAPSAPSSASSTRGVRVSPQLGPGWAGLSGRF